jgi:hypothetical protein
MDGYHVHVSIPLVGFPEGFVLRPGERVMVMVEDSGLAARPLVETVVIPDSFEDSALRESMDINGVPHTLQAATISEVGRGTVVWVVDSGSATGPKQIVATRRM